MNKIDYWILELAKSSNIINNNKQNHKNKFLFNVVNAILKDKSNDDLTIYMINDCLYFINYFNSSNIEYNKILSANNIAEIKNIYDKSNIKNIYYILNNQYHSRNRIINDKSTFKIYEKEFTKIKQPDISEFNNIEINTNNLIETNVPKQISDLIDGEITIEEALSKNKLIFYMNDNATSYDRDDFVKYYNEKKYIYECKNDVSPLTHSIIDDDIEELMLEPFILIQGGFGNYLIALHDDIFIIKTKVNIWYLYKTEIEIIKTISR
jgi:hypothetical protein